MTMPNPPAVPALLAELPAGAVSALYEGLSGSIMIHARLANTDDPARRHEAIARVQDIVIQQSSFAGAWHRPADEIMPVRIGGRFLDEALHTLERCSASGPEVAATIEALKTAMLTRDGLLNPDGSITLPDSP